MNTQTTMALIRPDAITLQVVDILERNNVPLSAVDQVLSLLEQVANPWPHGSTVRLASVANPDLIGWAKRGPLGELLTAVGGLPLDDATAWVITEER